MNPSGFSYRNYNSYIKKVKKRLSLLWFFNRKSDSLKIYYFIIFFTDET